MTPGTGITERSRSPFFFSRTALVWMTRSQLRKRFADLTRREARKLFLSYEGKARTFDYQAGDVGYVSFLRQLFR